MLSIFYTFLYLQIRSIEIPTLFITNQIKSSMEKQVREKGLPPTALPL